MKIKQKPLLKEFVIGWDTHWDTFLMSRGWGNGYVAISPGHPLYEKDYNDIDLNVHGGLTFSGYAKELNIPKEYKIPDKFWILGFDTAHWGDSLERWPDKQSVLTETLRLKEQIEKYEY